MCPKGDINPLLKVGVIFDLDQTLIDSVMALQDRQSGNWNSVYSKIPQFKVFDGIEKILRFLNTRNIPVCIVTSSPRSYCEKVLSSLGIKVCFSICYHDSKNHKPHPEPILIAKNKLINEYCCSSIISIGDTQSDLVASQKANVISIAALWGSQERKLLQQSQAHYILHTPIELYNLFLCTRQK